MKESIKSAIEEIVDLVYTEKSKNSDKDRIFSDQELWDKLRIGVKYLIFENEAFARENKHLQRLIRKMDD